MATEDEIRHLFEKVRTASHEHAEARGRWQGAVAVRDELRKATQRPAVSDAAERVVQQLWDAYGEAMKQQMAAMQEYLAAIRPDVPPARQEATA